MSFLFGSRFSGSLPWLVSRFFSGTPQGPQFSPCQMIFPFDGSTSPRSECSVGKDFPREPTPPSGPSSRYCFQTLRTPSRRVWARAPRPWHWMSTWALARWPPTWLRLSWCARTAFRGCPWTALALSRTPSSPRRWTDMAIRAPRCLSQRWWAPWRSFAGESWAAWNNSCCLANRCQGHPPAFPS